MAAATRARRVPMSRITKLASGVQPAYNASSKVNLIKIISYEVLIALLYLLLPATSGLMYDFSNIE